MVLGLELLRLGTVVAAIPLQSLYLSLALYPNRMSGVIGQTNMGFSSLLMMSRPAARAQGGWCSGCGKT